MALTLRDNLYKSTCSSMWVCLIHGRFLISKKGRTGWNQKSSAALAFKNSCYWDYITWNLKKKHMDKCEENRWGVSWKNQKEGEEMEKEVYQNLIKEGVVKYIEIKPIPEWTNL